MDSFSPCRRRTPPPYERRVDSTPMLMSSRSVLDVSDIITPDGRIVLTPTRAPSARRLDDDDGSIYEEVGTPPNDRMRTTPVRDHGQGRSVYSPSKGFSEPLILEESSMHPRRTASQIYHSASHRSTVPSRSGLSRRTVRVLHFVSSAVVALSLLAAVLLRVNVISAVYLLALCCGVFQSFASGRLLVATIVVSSLACIGHIVFAAWLDRKLAGWNGEHVLGIIGFVHISDSADGVIYPGLDALVLLCSMTHFFVVMRRLQLPDQDNTFDLFEEAGAQLLRQDRDDMHKIRRRANAIHGVELLAMLLLFLTAFIVPAGATAVLYVALLCLLVSWTVFAKRVSVEEFASGNPKKEFLVGHRVAKLLLTWCFVVIVAWYVLLFADLAATSPGRYIIKYAGFANFREGSVRWQYYTFAALLSLLFACMAKLVNLHSAFAKMQMNRSQVGETSEFPPHQHVKGYDVTGFPPRTYAPSEVAKLLRELPFSTRVFLHEGGSLLASGSAIAWCVSYPSYGNAPMMGLALLTLGLYGVVPSGPIVKLLIFYGTLLSMTEYAVNLTWDFIGGDYAKYGLKQFEYPFLDLGVHNVCLIVIFASMRTRWRYEVVIEASKSSAPNPDAASPTHETERNSIDALRHVVQLRRGTEANWRNFIPLWLQDAKQVFLTHLGALVLLTIVAVVLSTRESFFQAGYLVLAMMCIIFFKHRQKLWRLLLAYALVICLAVFVRNVDCTPNYRLDLIGLECYNEAETWGSLWPTLFSAQLVIILQLVFQLVIYVSNADTIDERMRTIEFSHKNPIFFVSRIAVEVDNLYRVIGSAVCYILILYVVFRHELVDSGAHTTVLGCVQLLVLLIVVGGHLGKFKRAPRSSLRLKLLWSFVMIVEVIILVARYVFHFQDVSNYFEKHVFTTDFMSPRDFGLEKLSSKKSLSGVFFYLAPTTLLIGLIFWQLSSIMQEVRPYEVLVAGRNRLIDQILFWMETLRQTLIAFSTTALVIVTMCVALQHINAIGAAYLLVLVLGRPLSSWQKLWFPLFWVSVIAIAGRYAYQLRFFGGLNSANDGYKDVDLGNNAEWFGLGRLVEDDSNDKTTLWQLESGPLLVILMCFLQRMAQYFETASKKMMAGFEQAQCSSQVSSQPLSSPEDPDTFDVRLSAPAKAESPAQPLSASARTPASPEQAPRGIPPFMEEQRVSVNDEADFLSHLRDFCIEYAGSASVNVVMLLLTASSFTHRDVISIGYLVVVYGMMYANPHTVCKLWFFLAAALSVILIGEYGLLLWLPPLVGVERENTSPWKHISLSKQQWLALGNQHKWALLADFVALLATYMLPNSQRLSKSAPNSDVQILSQSSKRGLPSSARALQIPSESYDGRMLVKAKTHDFEESEFMRKTRSSAWHALVYFFILGWLPVTLVVIFVCGATHGGIASFVYIGTAVFMLYRLDEARLPSSKWIHQLRKFNWAHLFIMVVISAPYVKDDLSRCLVGSRPDGSSMAGDVCLSVEDLLGVQTVNVPAGIIAIFVLISIQCEMLSTDTYHYVCQYIQLEKMQAPVRQEEIVRRFYKERTAQWFLLKKEKSAALQRLKMIVSKLVHKVEELMDIATGLHYNLPPMAPAKPRAIDYYQNAITLEWDPPEENRHKIRYYRITRQQYPSQTLLGDFSDVVEVKGDVTSVKLEGLRPGTSYQFKVAAVSRMGEGPFSVATDPVSTYPLNLNGSCTAGWMKYRRQSVTKTWMSIWLSWIQPKYLHRYVVLDARTLVFYKNEELALRHRSKKRRKKIKTAFPWKNVVTLRLSDTKVQFDDVSPMLFCFELIVRQEGNHADVKYVFQADLAKDFDRYLSALAFSVPRHAVDDSILQCLEDKNLSVPQLAMPTDYDDGVDEAGSEMSSVTGDESSFGDAEDADFDEPNRRSWRIPVYRWLYSLQDAAMQAETIAYDPDDQVEPTISEIVSVAINAIRSRTAQWCYALMILAFARQADLLNFVYVVCTFGYLAIESPRPSSHSWLLLLKYTCTVVLIRYAFQLPVFCQGLSGTGYYYPSIQPFCGAPENSIVLQDHSIQPTVVVGIFKFDGVTLGGVDTIFEGLQWNFYVALAILWHRRELIVRGLWVDSAQIDEDQNALVFGSRRQVNSSELSSRDSIDESFNFGGGGRVILQPARHPERVTSSESTHSFVGVEPDQPNQLQETQLAEELLQELEAEEVQKETLAMDEKIENGNVDMQERRSTSQPESSADAVNAVTEQIEMEDVSGPSRSHYGTQKKSWLELKYPQVDAFFKRVICDPPAQWDKDIHAAISGAKPGRDYFASSLAVNLFAAVFAIVFFEQIGDRDSKRSSTAAQVNSSSMVSGYLVLIVFIQLCFIIWDRAAYVCGSLGSKMVLQYSYIVLLHMSLWILMPHHIGTYFQERLALVLFYLMHCAYLWLGALQIRYGYPVFKGSQFNYSSQSAYQKVNEKVFPLVRQAPFLFEMRALLDYVCTKTSLSWQHWVLLEDTAAHLFTVKLEMRGRVEDAEVLQGKKRQPVHSKLMTAGVMVLFFLLCLIGPLLLFSSANPSTEPNRVKSTELTFGIEDARGTVNKLYTGVDINSRDYEGDQIADGAVMQRITYDTFSRDVWASSPPNLDRLVSQLKSKEKLSWIVTISFTRPEPVNFLTIGITKRVALTSDDRVALAPMIQLASPNKTERDATPILVKAILPAVVELTAISGVLELSTQLRSVQIAKHTFQGASWWSMEPILRNTTRKKNANDRELCDAAHPFCLIAVSDNIVQGLNSLGIGSYGITAVYIFVLVTVGSAVKGFFRGALFQIQYSELPDPDDVLELVEGIYIARGERYVGHLKDEVRIFETLVRVLRSPETLSKVTGTNVIHIPKAKEKIE